MFLEKFKMCKNVQKCANEMEVGTQIGVYIFGIALLRKKCWLNVC